MTVVLFQRTVLLDNTCSVLSGYSFSHHGTGCAGVNNYDFLV
jgi:hypothetical protein